MEFNDSIGHLVVSLLGPTGSVALLGLLGRKFIGERLNRISWLARRELRNRAWRLTAKRRIEALEREVDRQRWNMHELRNWCSGLDNSRSGPKWRPHQGGPPPEFPDEKDDDDDAEKDEGDFE